VLRWGAIGIVLPGIHIHGLLEQFIVDFDKGLQNIIAFVLQLEGLCLDPTIHFSLCSK
jgi:hypothetical protein